MEVFEPNQLIDSHVDNKVKPGTDHIVLLRYNCRKPIDSITFSYIHKVKKPLLPAASLLHGVKPIKEYTFLDGKSMIFIYTIDQMPTISFVFCNRSKNLRIEDIVKLRLVNLVTEGKKSEYSFVLLPGGTFTIDMHMEDEFLDYNYDINEKFEISTIE
jgi:hypothetical protein